MSVLNTLFLENKTHITKTNYTTMLFMSTQVSEMKIEPKSRMPFSHETIQMIVID